jgi:hypothetical protein
MVGRQGVEMVVLCQHQQHKVLFWHVLRRIRKRLTDWLIGPTSRVVNKMSLVKFCADGHQPDDIRGWHARTTLCWQ